MFQLFLTHFTRQIQGHDNVIITKQSSSFEEGGYGSLAFFHSWLCRLGCLRWCSRHVLLMWLLRQGPTHRRHRVRMKTLVWHANGRLGVFAVAACKKRGIFSRLQSRLYLEFAGALSPWSLVTCVVSLPLPPISPSSSSTQTCFVTEINHQRIRAAQA